MELKSKIENHPVVLFGGAAVLSFAAGWTAHVSFQKEVRADTIDHAREKQLVAQVESLQQSLAHRDAALSKERAVIEYFLQELKKPQPGARPTILQSPAASPQPSTAATAPTPPKDALGSLDKYKFRAASRMVSASPGKSYLGQPPDVLLAIPVIEIEVNADGSLKRLQVLRTPSDPNTADTVQLAIDAIQRAAPYGDATALPRPWKWSEVFLFNDSRQFKPRTLD